MNEKNTVFSVSDTNTMEVTSQETGVHVQATRLGEMVFHVDGSVDRQDSVLKRSAPLFPCAPSPRTPRVERTTGEARERGLLTWSRLA
jgi:hypothetical protein